MGGKDETGDVDDGGREAGGSGFNIHPMEQFEVHPLFGGDEVHWYTPTNATLWMALTVIAVSLLMIAGSRGRALVPSRMQSIAESIYGFVHKMIEDVTGKEGAKYFPYIITLFLFILFANLLALIPARFASTSHIAVTALLALAVFITVTAIGFYKHGAHFLNLFWVASAPTVALRIVLARDRGHLLLRAPAQPLRPTCRQHDGRPRGAEGLRRASPARSASRPSSRSSRSPPSTGSS